MHLRIVPQMGKQHEEHFKGQDDTHLQSLTKLHQAITNAFLIHPYSIFHMCSSNRQHTCAGLERHADSASRRATHDSDTNFVLHCELS